MLFLKPDFHPLFVLFFVSSDVHKFFEYLNQDQKSRIIPRAVHIKYTLSSVQNIWIQAATLWSTRVCHWCFTGQCMSKLCCELIFLHISRPSLLVCQWTQMAVGWQGGETGKGETMGRKEPRRKCVMVRWKETKTHRWPGMVVVALHVSVCVCRGHPSACLRLQPRSTLSHSEPLANHGHHMTHKHTGTHTHAWKCPYARSHQPPLSGSLLTRCD